MQYILLYGRLTSKKPKYYCKLHRTGLGGRSKKSRCSKCKHRVPVTAALLSDIRVG